MKFRKKSGIAQESGKIRNNQENQVMLNVLLDSNAEICSIIIIKHNCFRAKTRFRYTAGYDMVDCTVRV